MRSDGFDWGKLMFVIMLTGIVASALLPHYFDYPKQKAVAMEFFDGKEVQLDDWMFNNPTQISSFAKDWCFNNGVAANQLEAKTKELVDKFNYVVKNSKVSLESFPAEATSEVAKQEDVK